MRTRIYLGHSPFHIVLVEFALNQIIVHIIPQYHVLFYDKLFTASFISKDKFPPNTLDLVQKIALESTPKIFISVIGGLHPISRTNLVNYQTTNLWSLHNTIKPWSLPVRKITIIKRISHNPLNQLYVIVW